MVWQPAQLSEKRSKPCATLALPRLRSAEVGSPTPPGASEVTKATMSRIWLRVKRGGLATGSAVGSASGIQPDESQRSTVAAPRPRRFGARAEPSAPEPWQAEQFSSKRV